MYIFINGHIFALHNAVDKIMAIVEEGKTMAARAFVAIFPTFSICVSFQSIAKKVENGASVTFRFTFKIA